MRLLALPRYGRDVASSRYRLYQFLPFLERAGVETLVSPLLPDRYVSLRFRRPWMLSGSALRGALHRTAVLRRAGAFDLVWLEKEAFPFIPSPMERMSFSRVRRYVVDYDDAWFERYQRHPNAAVRALLKRKIGNVIADATSTIVGSHFLMDYASHLTEHVEFLPTVVDLSRYPLEDGPAKPRPFTIGWIGSPSSETFLADLRDMLAKFCQEHDSRLIVIGAAVGELWFPGMRAVPWSEATEVGSLTEIDVGIMPLHDTTFAQGKCALKAIQYMACWKPVIASPVGEAREVVRHGESGFLASSSEEWWKALEALLSSASLRKAMGCSGRTRVQERYSLDIAAPRLVSILEAAAAGPGRGEREGSAT